MVIRQAERLDRSSPGLDDASSQLDLDGRHANRRVLPMNDEPTLRPNITHSSCEHQSRSGIRQMTCSTLLWNSPSARCNWLRRVIPSLGKALYRCVATVRCDR